MGDVLLTSFISMLVPKPSDITSMHSTFRGYYVLTTPMLLAIPNTRRTIESRQSISLLRVHFVLLLSIGASQ